jgi:catechol 2,3-dioxygenase-like lactoylglutathione lyase family enzyme
MPSPIFDLAGLTLEVNQLDRAVTFYQTVFGLPLITRDDELGSATLQAGSHQTLTLWQPVTRRPLGGWLAPLHPRGAAHLHYAWQTMKGDLDTCKTRLTAHGVSWQDINLGTPERPDFGLYFFDPFGHGLEIREIDLGDDRHTALPPQPRAAGTAVPVIGLREAALAFGDYPAMLERLPRAYGFAFAKEQEDRNFAQFTLGPAAQRDGNDTPARWLYAWDPQVGLAEMLGGDHALVEVYADVGAVRRLVQAEGLQHAENGTDLAVCDPEGHVFVFRPLPEQ